MLVLRFIEGKNKQFNKNRKYFEANSIYIENCQQNKKPHDFLQSCVRWKSTCVQIFKLYTFFISSRIWVKVILNTV